MTTTPSWACCTNEDTENYEQFINCIRCNKSYHFHCLSIPEIPNDSDIYRQWKCPGCMILISKTVTKDSTPMRNISTTRGNKRQALNSPPASTALTADDVRSIVQEVIKTEFATLLQQINNTIVSTINRELEPIKKDVDELKTSLTFHTKEFDEFQSDHVKAMSCITGLEDENRQLKNTVAELNYRLNYLEQHARSNNLEIQCLTESTKENLYTVVKQLGSAVGYELKDVDILHATRIAKLNTKNPRPRSIVVQLASPRTRDSLLAAVIEYNKKHSLNKLNTANFGLAGNKTPVYVVEHLSPSNKALHAATRLKAKEKGYKYVWVRGGRIFVKKTDDADHVLIKNQDTLNKLL